MCTFYPNFAVLQSPGEESGNALQFLAWETPWTDETRVLQPMGSQRVGRD